MARVPQQGRGDITLRHMLVFIIVLFQKFLRTLLFLLLASSSHCAQNPNSVIPLYSVKTVVNSDPWSAGVLSIFVAAKLRY